MEFGLKVTILYLLNWVFSLFLFHFYLILFLFFINVSSCPTGATPELNNLGDLKISSLFAMVTFIGEYPKESSSCLYLTSYIEVFLLPMPLGLPGFLLGIFMTSFFVAKLRSVFGYTMELFSF